MQELEAGKKIRIHKGLGYSPEPRTRIVSKGKYAAVKSLAVCLSGGIYACGIGITLLLATLPCTYYVDSRSQAQNVFSHYSLVAIAACVIFIPILLFIVLFLWLGSRKSWKIVRTMQPINPANTADLPASDSLVRASQEPAQAQEGVLLRAAAGEAQAGQEGQLLRASVGSE